MSTCPSLETLASLAHDSSAATRFAEVDGHIEMCASCQEALERMAEESLASRIDAPGRLPFPGQPPSIPGFLIECELGRGGMGVVYQAWEEQLARRVAIKVVGGGIGDAERSRWLDEARAIARLRHRNVVQIHQADEHGGCLYFVLDLIHGGTLAERARGPLPARVAAELMVTVARTVHDLHQAGIVHLDLKPSNILLDGPLDGRWDQLTPMVTDFGISSTKDESDAASVGRNGVRGTPSYMAPEQFAADRSAVGERTDVYALGATLYSLLTGRPPFQATSPMEALALVCRSEPGPPGTLVPGLPRDLETIVLTCLHKDPQRRFPSAGALADDLQRFLYGFPIRARPISTMEHASRWCRRRPGFAALLAIFTLTVASSLVGLFLLWRQSENALARAVASDKSASVAIRDLVGLLAETADSPQLAMLGRLESASRVVRDLMAKSRRDQGLSVSNAVAICDIAHVLSWHFRGRGQNSRSRALLEETLSFLEEMTRRGDNPQIDEWYGKTFFELAYVALNEKNVDEALVYSLRADKILSRLVHEPRDSRIIFLIDGLRRMIAELLDRGGQVEARQRLLESHIQLLERLDHRPSADPSIGLLAELARLSLAPDADACAKLRARFQRFPAHTQLSEPIRSRLGDWFLSEIDPYPSRADASDNPMVLLAPDAYADAVIQAIESRCEAIGADASVFPEVVFQFALAASSRASEQRKAGRVDDARRISACLSAFAMKAVRRNPDEAKFHIVMSEAFMQESKFYWTALAGKPDYGLIEMAWRSALDEAGTALRLDPTKVEGRLRIAKLQEKLVNLAAERSSQ